MFGIKAIHKRLKMLEDYNAIYHQACCACGEIGHVPDMRGFTGPEDKYALHHIYESCIAGSEYEWLAARQEDKT